MQWQHFIVNIKFCVWECIWFSEWQTTFISIKYFLLIFNIVTLITQYLHKKFTTFTHWNPYTPIQTKRKSYCWLLTNNMTLAGMHMYLWTLQMDSYYPVNHSHTHAHTSNNQPPTIPILNFFIYICQCNYYVNNDVISPKNLIMKLLIIIIIII